MDKTYNQAVIEINQLQPNPFQPRDKIKKNDIADLTESIKLHGILEPLVVAETPAGFQIIAGERRWRAAKEAGLIRVPVHIKKTTPKGMLEMAIVENVQRINLNPIERAQAFQRLNREFGFSLADISIRVGKSASYVSNSLKLLSLPDAITDGLLGMQISEGHARALSGITDEDAMVECYKIILKEGASVRRAEELSRRFRQKLGQKNVPAGRPIAQDEEQIKKWQKNLNTLFNRPSVLKLIRSRNHTRITITLKGTPESTQDDLEKIIKLTN
jgi:ParB family transcriptional regulator, chromosome partitioning protein